MFKKLSITVFSLLLLTSVSAHGNCGHGKVTNEQLTLDVDERLHFGEGGRNLATTSYPQIRIAADYTLLTAGTADFITYVKKDLMPPVVDYFQAAIKVKAPLTSNLQLSSSASSICGFSVPAGLRNGTPTDFYVIVSSTTDTDNWVASAGSCYVASGTKRPLIAKMMFNMQWTFPAGDDVLAHEKNMYLTMHEMMHALGFAGASFPNFIDANGNTLTGHIKTVSLNSNLYTVLAAEPLLTRVRNHFGCSTLPGAFLENDGGDGTAGSHFERRHFLYDHMTSGVINGRRISEFSLAVLESSGWYLPDYTFAEPFFWGQGEGCNFLYTPCTATGPNFDEFCYATSRKCTAVGRSGGVCTSDTRSDNCTYSFPIIDNDCENDGAVDNARLPTLETFGRTAGSKCFEGNLTTLTKSTATTYCFKYTCSGTGLSAKVLVTIGSTTVTCASQTSISVPGLNGKLNCPDPLSFCSTVGKKYCQRNCLGRGTCNTTTGVCACKAGFTGVDCALTA